VLPAQTQTLLSWPNPVAHTSDGECLENGTFVSELATRPHKSAPVQRP
jgi:hypothetical protein